MREGKFANFRRGFASEKKKQKMAVSISRPQPIGPTVIGPSPWRDSTMSGIRDNNKVIGRSDETVKFGRSVDPLPHLRFIAQCFYYVVVFTMNLCVVSNKMKEIAVLRGHNSHNVDLDQLKELFTLDFLSDKYRQGSRSKRRKT